MLKSCKKMAIDPDSIEEIIYIIIGLVAAVSNLLEIILIRRNTRRLRPHDKLLLSLAASDLFVAVTVTAYKICDFAIDNNHWLDEKVFSIILVATLMMSGLNLIAITLDRFLAIKYPLRHRVFETRIKINLVLLAIWITGASLMACFSGLIFTKIVSETVLFYIASAAALFFGLFIAVLYCFIIHKTCESRAMTRDSSSNHRQVLNSFFSSEYQKERHLFFTCCLIYLSFIFCSYPFAINFLVHPSAEEVLPISRILLVVNSILNPFVYFFKGYLERNRREQVSNVTPMSQIR